MSAENDIVVAWMADISRRLGRMEEAQDGLIVEVGRTTIAVQTQNGNVANTVALVAEIDGRLGIHLEAHKAIVLKATQDGAFRSGFAQGEQALRTRWTDRAKRLGGWLKSTDGVVKAGTATLALLGAILGLREIL